MPVSVEQTPAAFLMSALGCVLLGRRFIRRLAACGWIQPIRYEDCPPLIPSQQTKQGTPTMGGVFVLGVAAVVAAVFGGLSGREGWVVLAALVGVGAIGMVDDLLKFRRPNAGGLRGWPKLVAALVMGAGIGALLSSPSAGYRQALMPWLGKPVELGWCWIPLTAFAIAGCAHAVNLTDGMDGLATGCLAIAFGVLGLLALLAHNRLVAVWCASLTGSCVGFLWFNSFPASVFLGDVGALGLGAALGVVALLLHSAFGLAIVGGVFLVEAGSVILQVASYRLRHKRRLFRVAPLHHHFQLGGVSEQKLVVRFWIAGLLLAALGLSAFAHS